MGEQTLELDIFSDVACPYCYIGKRHLELATKALGVTLKINWRSFLLNKDAPKKTSKDRYTFLAEKYGRDRQWAIDLSSQIAAQARAVGIEFNFDTNQPSNTFDAHRLLHLAKQHDCQSQLKEALMKAYFCDGELVADHDVLRGLALRVGLEPEGIEAVLNSNLFADEVNQDNNLAQELRISSVPSFVIAQKYIIVGGQGVDKFQQLLSRILNDI